MRRVTLEQLRTATLRRQFPRAGGHPVDAVPALFERLGPIQSQVPRAPFLTASSRLPGVSYATMVELFEQHRLVKSSSLRGTVHTTTAAHFPGVETVARQTRGATMLRSLGLHRAVAEGLVGAIEDYCRDSWRTREDVVAYGKLWLSEHDQRDGATPVWNVASESYLWGHSGLLRRPPTTAWETRTDTLRRTATEVLGYPRADVRTAVRDLIRGHLAAYGPVCRDDLVFFLGCSVRQVESALADLDEELLPLTGPDGERYLDLVALPVDDGEPDPGLRLLPEFDGLLLGYHGRGRTRFLDADHLPRVWAKTNGLFAPVVLHDQRIQATWRTVTSKRFTSIEVTMLPGFARLAEERFSEQRRAVESALGLAAVDLVVRPAP